MSLTFDAVLLAAGQSRRMGSDKALLPGERSGERLWERQWRLLAEAGAVYRWLSVREDQPWPAAEMSRHRVNDLAEGGGPLGGVVAAWKKSEATHLMVVAVDLPRLPPAWFWRLREKCRSAVGAVGQHPDGAFEPLAGIYPRTWLPVWETALSQGRRSLQALLTEAAESGVLAVEPIAAEEGAWFHNVNHPSDLEG